MDSPTTVFNWDPEGDSRQNSLVSDILNAGLRAVRRLKAAVAAQAAQLARVVADTSRLGYHPREINKNKRQRVHGGLAVYQTWSARALRAPGNLLHNVLEQKRRI